MTPCFVPATGNLPPFSIRSGAWREKTNDLDGADLLTGSDCWTAEEKRYFNKGIAAYRKDFIMVQKLVGIARKWSLLVVPKSWNNNLFQNK